MGRAAPVVFRSAKVVRQMMAVTTSFFMAFILSFKLLPDIKPAR
jgi:hypothetical protein